MTATAISPDGKLLATANYDGTIKLWNAETGAPVFSLTGHGSRVLDLAFNKDSDALASCAPSSEVIVWNLKVGREQRRWSLLGKPSCVTFDAERKSLLVVANSKGRISTWDVTTGQALFGPFVYGADAVVRCAMSSDKRSMAVVGRDRKKLLVFDTGTGEIRFSTDARASLGQAVAFTPDGKRLANFSADAIVLRDAYTGEEIRTFADNAAQTLAISPDGKKLAAGGAFSARIWDINTGASLQRLGGHNAVVQAIAFGPKSRLLATGSYDSTVKLWNLTHGRERITKRAHSGSVTCLAFSPDGRRMLTGSQDNTAILWNIAKQTPLTTLPHTGSLSAVAFSPDGRTFATAAQPRRKK